MRGDSVDTLVIDGLGVQNAIDRRIVNGRGGYGGELLTRLISRVSARGFLTLVSKSAVYTEERIPAKWMANVAVPMMPSESMPASWRHVVNTMVVLYEARGHDRCEKGAVVIECRKWTCRKSNRECKYVVVAGAGLRVDEHGVDTHSEFVVC